MANQITDNRLLVDDAGNAANYAAAGGGGSAADDTDIKIEGTQSIGEQISSSRRFIMFDAGATQDWSSNVFYIWINCGIVGLLDLKVNGGFTIRFAGPTVTNFFEFYVGGSDSWPVAIEGGWVQFVVDIEATPSNTGGTPPATNLIQHVGYSAVTASVMTKASDNTWIDEIRRLPDGDPGIIVEGSNAGATPWNSSDIVTELTTAVGTFVNGPGGSYMLNTPIQFGINDTTTHEFLDTNVTWLWQYNEFAPSDLYKLSALGNSGGTTNVTLGVKTGTGDDATGAQGATITGDAVSTNSVRWDMDFNDPDLDLVAFYGCLLPFGGAFLLDDPSVSFISTLMVDCTSAAVSNAEILRCSIIDANSLDSVAFMSTDDLTDIVFCSFEFSDGHAVEILSGGPSVQASKGNLYTSYLGTPGSNLVAGASGSTDAAISNNAGAARTINISDSGDTPSVRNELGTPSTTVSNPVTYTLTGLVAGTEVRIFRYSDGVQLAGVETSGTSFPYAYDYLADTDSYVIVQKFDYVWQKFNVTFGNANVSQAVIQRPDINAVA